MIAIADAAEGDWPKRARKSAAVIAKNKATIEAGLGLQLLEDIRDVFDRLGVDRLLSRKLIEELAVDPEKPWAEYRPESRSPKSKWPICCGHISLLPSDSIPKGGASAFASTGGPFIISVRRIFHA